MSLLPEHPHPRAVVSGESILPVLHHSRLQEVRQGLELPAKQIYKREPHVVLRMKNRVIEKVEILEGGLALQFFKTPFGTGWES